MATYSFVKLKDNSIATGHDGSIKLWNKNNFQLITTFSAHTGKVSSLAVLSNGLLISGSNDFTIKIWNSTYLVQTLNDHNSSVSNILVFKTNYLAIGYMDGYILIYENVTTSPVLSTTLFNQSSNVERIVNLKNKVLAVGYSNGFIDLWDISNGFLVSSLNDTTSSLNDLITFDDYLIRAASDGTIKAINFTDNSLVLVINTTSPAIALAIISTRLLLVGCSDGILRVYLNDGTLFNLFSIHTDSILSLLTLSDTYVFSLSSDMTAIELGIFQFIFI